MPSVVGYHPNGSPSATRDLSLGPLNSANKQEPRDEAKHSPEELTEAAPSRSLTTKDAAIAEFFSQKTFQLVLHNPTTAHQLLRFSQDRLCGESMEFLKKVDRYNTLLDETMKTISEIHRSFISTNAPTPINLSQPMADQIREDIKTTTSTTLPAMELIFSDAQEQIEDLLATDIYPRFVKHQMTASAVQALGSDKNKYAGLGDCFVLTNPAIADNPIVYASDGFVKVTGYSRTDIIPRNCRFLQGDYTEKATVRRLRASIDANNESVELLLNYRKDGQPFWNLLYVTPLLDQTGKVAFFLGGQINCSTTVHSSSDVMRVLSTHEGGPDDEDTNSVMTPTSAEPVKRYNNLNNLSSRLRALRGQRPGLDDANVSREAGMEQGLVNQIERMRLKDQVDTFYTAYSKFIILSLPDFLITFYSPSFFEMLCLSPTAAVNFPGTNIFKLLKEHTTNTSRDLKGKVRTAVKMGKAISVEASLMTRHSVVRSRSERCKLHWTPLKDERGAVGWCVLTVGFVR
ncbi:MAG: hypothetical protein Q9160_002030 [Pyrenula sp. 1 TL-2023]